MSDEAVVQILKAINDFREEFRDEKKKNEKRWEENDKRWKESDKRWEENERRWEENERRWEENNGRWIENEENRKRDRDDIKNILWSFQTSVEQMYKENRERIIKIEKLCPKCNLKVM